MSSSEIFITKRDGKRERFSIDKIRAAIAKAFLSVGSFATDEMLTQILGRIRVADGTTVEQIQNQVETALMAERYYKVAKAYIIYRQEHTEDREVRDKLQFLMNYCEAKNPATGSKYDANANVENKNIATLIGELPKQNFIRLNRRLLTDRLKEMYGKEVSDRYLELLDRHFIYKNDETSLANYCASITMYPWLLSGTTSIGGNSTRPTNLKSFCGGFVNMVFIVSSMLSGACATPEFLMYMNYFIAQEFGEDYYRRADEVVDLSRHRRTIDKVITDCFEQVVYSINQPTGARNFQAVFWNIAYYDRYYFESLFGEFRFPDGSRPDWEGLSWLQKRFMKWFNAERLKTVLTFPVETMALLTRNGDVMDAEWGDFTAQMYAEGHSFFTYMSDNADSLSSCCRLRNEIQDNGFSYTLGAGGVSTGSKSVLTINLNRCIQYAERQGIPYLSFLEEVVDLTHKVQLAYNENLKELQRKGMLPLFDAGYINLSRQYLTIGINGLVDEGEIVIRIESQGDDILATVEDNGVGMEKEKIQRINVLAKKAKETGYVETLFNRRRYIPELKSNNYMVRQFGQRVAMNTPIQGTAADIMKIAMINVMKELKSRNMKSKIVLQVHDEMMIETALEEVDEVKDILKEKTDKKSSLTKSYTFEYLTSDSKKSEYVTVSISKASHKKYGIFNNWKALGDDVVAEDVTVETDPNTKVTVEGVKLSSKYLDKIDDKHYAVVGYKVGKTLSPNGAAKRGICKEENGKLKDLIESSVEKIDDKIIHVLE